MKCSNCGNDCPDGTLYCAKCGNKVADYCYLLDRFDPINIEEMFRKFNLQTENYFFVMTNVATYKYLIAGSLANFSRQYAVINFNVNEIVMFMFSRLDNKKVTNIIRLSRNEILKTKVSNHLISYNLSIETNNGNFHFQLFKKYGKFDKQKDSINKFQQMFPN